jgi:hypothetical protein
LPGKRNQRPTALEALALKVPSEGPKVDIVAIAPWEVPNWVEHVSYMGVENLYNRKAWIHNLTAVAPGTSTLLIHLAAATLNRETEGLDVVGSAAATYLRGGAEITSHDWVIGSELTQFDADTYVLARVAEVLAQCYTPEVAPPASIYLFCSSSPALQAIRNTRSIKAHSHVLRFHTVLTMFFSNHRGVHLVLCWALKDDKLEGNWMARSLAAAACQQSLADLPDSLDRILSAAYQKDRARRRAFHQWELDYHLARVHNNLQVSATGFPLDRAAYQYAISQPPSKVNHPLWSAVVAMEKDAQGRKTRHPLFPRQTTSTALQLAVDHAFTGSYAKRFHPLDPPKSLQCPCGASHRNPNHLIRDCRLYYLTCISCKITTHGCTMPLKSLFSHLVEHAHRLLSFIHQMCAAMCPPEIGQPIPVEPEPD